MTIFRCSLIAALFSSAASAQDFPVPSGLKVSLFDVIVETDQYLCDEVASPALKENSWGQGDVIISYSAAELPFGETAPEITQFFQPFSLTNNTCQWEDF